MRGVKFWEGLVREMKEGKNIYFEDPNLELLAPSCIAALICYANATDSIPSSEYSILV